MKNPPPPCRCPTHDSKCERTGRPMTEREWELCSGKCPMDAPCTPEDSEKYRRLFDDLREGRTPLPVTPIPTMNGMDARKNPKGVCKHRGRRIRLPGEKRKYKQVPCPDG